MANFSVQLKPHCKFLKPEPSTMDFLECGKDPNNNCLVGNPADTEDARCDNEATSPMLMIHDGRKLADISELMQTRDRHFFEIKVQS